MKTQDKADEEMRIGDCKQRFTVHVLPLLLISLALRFGHENKFSPKIKKWRAMNSSKTDEHRMAVLLYSSLHHTMGCRWCGAV